MLCPTLRCPNPYERSEWLLPFPTQPLLSGLKAMPYDNVSSVYKKSTEENLIFPYLHCFLACFFHGKKKCFLGDCSEVCNSDLGVGYLGVGGIWGWGESIGCYYVARPALNSRSSSFSLPSVELQALLPRQVTRSETWLAGSSIRPASNKT